MIQEDGGNKFGERMFIAKIPAPGKKPIYHFIAQAGGTLNTRNLAKVSVPAGTWTSAKASEFSGVVDLSGILKSTTALGGAARRAADATVALEDKYIAVGLQAHSQLSGVIGEFNVDRGGQIYVYKPANIDGTDVAPTPVAVVASPAAKHELGAVALVVAAVAAVFA